MACKPLKNVFFLSALHKCDFVPFSHLGYVNLLFEKTENNLAGRLVTAGQCKPHFDNKKQQSGMMYVMKQGMKIGNLFLNYNRSLCKI